MTKMRFTDCDKWRDPWFMDLTMEMKMLWIYLCDNCDNAGVWEVNHRLAEFQLGQRIDWTMALNVMEGRVAIIADATKWHLTKFVGFQYPSGLGESNVHQQVRRLLAAHGLPYQSRGGEGSLKASGSLLDQTRPLSSSGGSPEGGTVSPPAVAENRKRLVKFLRTKRLSADEETLDEWYGLARDAGCKGIDQTLEMIGWATDCARARGVESVRYARHIETESKEWSRKRGTDRLAKGSA